MKLCQDCSGLESSYTGAATYENNNNNDNAIIMSSEYKEIRRRFIEASDSIFGPGFLCMAEYYFIEKKGSNPFAMLFSEPLAVYEEWVETFKGEEPVRKLFERAVGPSHTNILENVKRNDGFTLRNKMLNSILPPSPP